jgi:hypothetical protein
MADWTENKYYINNVVFKTLIFAEGQLIAANLEDNWQLLCIIKYNKQRLTWEYPLKKQTF